MSRYRLRVVQIGLLATMFANAAFTVSRLAESLLQDRATPWWCNAVSFVALVGLYGWFQRQPAGRVVWAVQGTAIIATVGLLVPLAYGYVSSLWWLSLVGLAMVLMANLRAALSWCFGIWALMSLAPLLIERAGIAPLPGEPVAEATLSRIVFPLIVFAIAFAFRWAVRSQARELRRSNQVKDRFMAHIGHEFRTPLHALLVNTEQALAIESDPAQRRRLQSAHASARLLLRQINQVISFSSGLQSPRPLFSEAYSPAQAVARCVSGLAEEAHRKGIKLEQHIDAELAERYQGDALAFEEILNALATNAVRFTERGGVRIGLQRLAGADGLRLTVADDGIGMDPEQRRRAMLPFGRGDESSTRSAGGLGLGLAHCRQLAERMNGRLDCQSSVGVGTTMIVDLPLTPAPICHALIDPTPAKADRSLKLLVCEDDEACRDLLVAGLQALGHQTVEAEDGQAALAALTDGDFDAIVSDLEMPRMDGLALLRALRAHSDNPELARLPIVLVTASATPENTQRFLDQGFDALLPKPFRLSDIDRELRRVVGASAAAA